MKVMEMEKSSSYVYQTSIISYNDRWFQSCFLILLFCYVENL